jgi:hypothetical protein
LRGVEDSPLSRQSATGGGVGACPMHQPRFSPQRHYLSASGTHFCKRLSKVHGLVRSERLGKFKISPLWVSNPRPSCFYHSLPRALIIHPARGTSYEARTTRLLGLASPLAAGRGAVLQLCKDIRGGLWGQQVMALKTARGKRPQIP